jgi:hypothetical protein
MTSYKNSDVILSIRARIKGVDLTPERAVAHLDAWPNQTLR